MIIRKAMLRSLAIEEDHQQFIDRWIEILDTHLHDNLNFMSLLNLVFHGMFCERGRFDPRQLHRFQNRFAVKDILQFASNCRMHLLSFFFFSN